MHRTLRHLASGASALAATLLLSAPAAHAAVSIHPGTSCSSDGKVSQHANGELSNEVPHANYIDDRTLFTCPVVLNQDNVQGNGVTIELMVRRNQNPVSNNDPSGFRCAGVSVRENGAIFDTTYANTGTYVPGTDSSKKLIITVNMPPAGTRATVLVRCAVPNAIAGEAAGVIGYRVSH